MSGRSVRELLLEARQRLAQQHSGALEAELLLGRVLGKPRAWLFANPSESLDSASTGRFLDLLTRREAGEPVAYLLGRREFWSLELMVTPDVLIPRPETEGLVQAALDFIPLDARWRIADLGTGSGAIAIAIARERPHCEIHATDLSPSALAVARANVEALAPGRICLHRGDWLSPLRGRFHVIVSNPPYVAGDDPHLAQGDCRFEPREALSSGPDGLAALRQIAADALPFLEPGGMLAVEHGYQQGATVRSWLEQCGYRQIRTRRDLEGRERVSLALAPL